jgi:hypothetical protein
VKHPDVWAKTSEELLAALATGKADRLAEVVQQVRANAAQWQKRLAQSGGNPKVAQSALPHLVRERMTHLALKETSVALAARKTEGPVRLGLWSGTVIQRLLFEKGLVRKPASMGAFRLLWPLVFDRKLLMPLVQPRGIYCFYSRQLVRALAALIGDRPCLELAAGDGTLARFLSSEGVSVTATDDASWSHAIAFPESVERLDAVAALRKYAPRAVVCSWPPAGNAFEKRVFETPSVELYVVIGSRHAFAAGDAAAYEQQTTFEARADAQLSAMVLPPELDPRVTVFRRRAASP